MGRHQFLYALYMLIGSKKYSNEQLLHRMNFQWTTQFKILGVYLDVDLTKVPALNYDKKLVKIKNIILQLSKDILPLWVGFH